jgi:hypothetical protein
MQAPVGPIRGSFLSKSGRKKDRAVEPCRIPKRAFGYLLGAPAPVDRLMTSLGGSSASDHPGRLQRRPCATLTLSAQSGILDFPNIADLALHKKQRNNCSRYEAESDPTIAHSQYVNQERHVTPRSQISPHTKGNRPDSVKHGPGLDAFQGRIEKLKRCRETICISQ